MSQLRQRHQDFQALGVTLAAISPDDAAATAKLAQRLELPFLLLSDPDLAAIDAYGVRHDDEPSGRLIPRPAVFIVDGAGRIRFAYKGDSVPDRPDEETILAIVHRVIGAQPEGLAPDGLTP